MTARSSALQIVKRRRLKLVIWLHTAEAPVQEEWERSLHSIVDHLYRRRVPRSKMRVLFVTDGGLPNARQRAEFEKALCRGEHRPVSIIANHSPDGLQRWTLEALSQSNPGILVFEPAKIEEALGHLDLRGTLPGLLPTFEELEQQTGPLAVLQALREALRSPGLDPAPAESGTFRAAAAVDEEELGAPQRAAHSAKRRA